jgi:uncharacterized membrane protein
MVCGLFYIVRLFVYQIELIKPSPEKFSKQYKIMTYRLWYIITLSAIWQAFLLSGCCFLLI